MRSQLKAEKSIRNPKIEGKRWTLYSTHDTKAEAEARARIVRKVHGKARVRKIPVSARVAVFSHLSDWGVYQP